MPEYTSLRRCETPAEPINDPMFTPNAPYAMAYVKIQRWEQPMDAMSALRCGTAFASLVKPFLAGEVQR